MASLPFIVALSEPRTGWHFGRHCPIALQKAFGCFSLHQGEKQVRVLVPVLPLPLQDPEQEAPAFPASLPSSLNGTPIASSVQAAVAKSHGLGASKHQKSIPHRSGGCKAEIRAPAWWGQGFSPGVRLLVAPSCGRRGSTALRRLFYKTTLSFRRALAL